VNEATKEFETKIGKAPTSFRGGALLKVPGLAAILACNGYLVDSSTTGCDPTPVRLLRWALGSIPQPYHPDSTYHWHPGNCPIVEMPVSHHALTKFMEWYLRAQRMYAFTNVMFLTLLIHIDEITEKHTGPNESSTVDMNALNRLKINLETIHRYTNIEFMTLSDAAVTWKNQLRRQPSHDIWGF
jgi:hypothetical protein